MADTKQVILVLGGLGYIGEVLQEALKDREDFRVVIGDNNLLKIANGNFYQHCDIRKKKDLRYLFERYLPSYVVNLAAIVGDPACLLDTRVSIQTNCNAMVNITDLCSEFGAKLIHASTCSVYGAMKNPKDQLTEESERNTVDFYGLTKVYQEDVAKRVEDALILRFGTVYGMSKRMRYDLVINLFAGMVANNEKIQVYGGEQIRPFVHTRDVARAIIHGIDNYLTGIYNLAGINISILKLARFFKKQFGAEYERHIQIQDPRNYNVSSKKLEKTGFYFKNTHGYLTAHIDEMIDHAKENDFRDPIYSNEKRMRELKNAKQ